MGHLCTPPHAPHGRADLVKPQNYYTPEYQIWDCSIPGFGAVVGDGVGSGEVVTGEFVGDGVGDGVGDCVAAHKRQSNARTGGSILRRSEDTKQHQLYNE